MFTTTNDTNLWILAIDGFIGAFNSIKALNVALSPLLKFNWDNCGYGSIQIIPPNTVAQNFNYENTTSSLVSEVQLIDIAGYIAKHADRQYLNWLRCEIDEQYDITAKSKKFKLKKEVDKKNAEDPNYDSFMDFS